jgi:Tetratricopeptide repeat
MTRKRWMFALLVVLLSGPVTSAQIVLSNPYARVRPSRGLAISVGVRGGYVVDTLSPLYLPPRITTIYYTPPPVVVIAPSASDDRRRSPFSDLDTPDDNEPVPHGVLRGKFRPLDNGDRERARQPLPPPPPEAPKKEEIPPPKREELPAPPKVKDKDKEKEKTPPVHREKPAPKPLTPQEEAERLLDLGRASFAELEFGRAAHRFRAALRLNPREPIAHFLLAEALLAQGKYHEAYDAVKEGLAQWPDWPTVRFRPMLLYGANIAGYPDQLRQLKTVLADYPDDPLLLFLSGYQLWFDGRRDEARQLFLRARPRLRDPALVEPFLKALPAEPAL